MLKFFTRLAHLISMNIKIKENNFSFNKYLPSKNSIIELFLLLTLLFNIFLTADQVLLLFLFVFSVLLSIIYIWFTGLWKKTELYIYIFLLWFTFYCGLIFVFLMAMPLLYLILKLFSSEDEILDCNIIILNFFFLSISFLILKYGLLCELITRKDIFTDLEFKESSQISLHFTLVIYNGGNSPLIISSNHPLFNFNGTSWGFATYNYFPLSLNETFCLKFLDFVREGSFEFLGSEYLYWLCVFMDFFSPFLKVALIIY